MANLSHTQPRTYELGASFQSYPQGAEKTYEGSAMSDAIVSSANTGVAHTLVAGEDFLGFCNETQDNSGGSAGSQTIDIITEGTVKLVVTGVTAVSTGATVYASDGNTFTLTSTSNSAVGKVVKIISGTTVLVKFQGIGLRSI